MMQAPSVTDRLRAREALRPQEFSGYITGLMELWLYVLDRPSRILELGTYIGNSTFGWLSCPNTTVTTIDNGPVQDQDHLRKDVEWYGWENRLSIVKDDSVSSASRYHGPPIDLLYIDTSHEYLQTRREIEAWLPHVKPQGWMVLDDACGYPEVLKAFQYCLETSCKGKIDYFSVYTRQPFTPESHGLLVAKLR